jgi:hypothetical protein
MLDLVNNHEDRVTHMQKLLIARNGRPYTRKEARRVLRGLARILTALATAELANRRKS